MSNYPAQIDNAFTLPPAIDNSTSVSANTFNQLRNAVVAIEATLGVNPQSVYGTVVSRLLTLETTISTTPYIQLAGDLGNTLADPQVVGIQGRPVSSAAPNTGQILGWNGIAWGPVTISGQVIIFSGDLSGSNLSQMVVGLQGHDVASTTPTSGQVLTFNGSQWAPASSAGGPPTGSAGGDLSGSYPNPTVSGIRGNSVPSPSGSNTVLTWSGSSFSWASGSGGITQLTTDVTAGPGSGSQVATVVGIRGISVPSPSGSNTVLTYNSGAYTWSAGSGGITQLTGDVTAGPGSGSQAATVVNIHGASVPAAGSLTTGNVLQVSGASSLTYAAVNLAGGANYVTGTLPSSNQAAQTMGGDVTGTTASSTVAKIQGNTVTSGALTKGQFFVASSTSNWAATTLSGDISESASTAGDLTVVGLRGNSLPSPSGTGTVLTWTGSALSWTSTASGIDVENQGSTIANNPHTTLNFTGSGVTASDAGSGVATINIPGGGSGVDIENSGTPIANNPHTTLNFTGSVSASDAGGGVATINVTGGGGGTLAGDVTGSSSSNTVAALQGTGAFLPQSTLEDGYTIIAEYPMGPVASFFFDSTNNLLWMGSWQNIVNLSANAVVNVMTPSTGDLVATITMPFQDGVRRLAADNSYVYATQSNEAGPLVVIISRSEYKIVGLLSVGTNGFSRDVCVDGSGNIWVTDNENGNVCKFLAATIANAVASYPTTQSPDITTPLANAESCCYDTTNNFLYVGAIGDTHIYQYNSSGTQTNAVSYSASGFSYFHGLIIDQGYLWSGTHSTSVIQIPLSTFTNTATWTNIPTSSTQTGDLYIDSYTTTLLVQNGNNNGTPQYIIRINVPAGTVASTITIPAGQTYPTAIATSSSDLWIGTNSATGIYQFTNTVGSETEVGLLDPPLLVYGEFVTTTRTSLGGTLYVDPQNVTGSASDSNNPQDTQVLTVARLNSALLLATLSTDLTIYFYSAPNSTDQPLDLTTLQVVPGVSVNVTVTGANAINYAANYVHTGTITGSTAIDPTTNTTQQISDSSFDFTAYLYHGYQVVDTHSGARNGNTCWLGQPYNLNVSSPVHSPYSSPIVENDNLFQSTMANTDPYTLWQPPLIYINCNGGSPGVNLVFDSVNLTGTIQNCAVTFNQCVLGTNGDNLYMHGSSITCNNCFIVSVNGAQSMYAQAGVFAGTGQGLIGGGAATAQYIEFSNDIFITAPIITAVNSVQSVAVDHNPNNGIGGLTGSGANFTGGIQLGPNTTLTNTISAVTGLIWGNYAPSSGTTYGIEITGGAIAIGTSPTPVITGNSGTDPNFVWLSTDGTLIHTYRAWNESSGVWSSQIANTWTNVFTSGNFYNAQDVSSGGKILVY